MAEIKLSGKIVKILPEQSGQGKFGKWIKQEFIVETTDKFPKKVCFTAWGDKTDHVKNLFDGDEVTVSFNPESREYNERWYTDLKAWRIEKGSSNSSPSNEAPPEFTTNDIPPEDDNDDLPF
ncbi:MAG: DUF3127 domain-containing protein [Bacteroidota bacterium]|nr:DUF3127 domain-containing protein [Bacteroidota bacterium]